jgi:hypothetical protein
MLLELYQTSRSLAHFQVDIGESHPWVKRLGRSEVLIAGLDASGMVTRIEYLGTEDAVKLFKIQQSNHANFPQVNWSVPVWTLESTSAAVQAWRERPATEAIPRVALLRAACAEAGLAKNPNRSVKGLREFCQELRPRFAAAPEAEFNAFPSLIERILVGTASAEAWVRSLSEAALAAAETGSAPLALVEELLGGEDGKVSILFDLADCTNFPRRVASPRMGAYFSRVLNATEAGSSKQGVCALTGAETTLEDDKMPSPVLPKLGPTVLMSMNPDTPCQSRYHHIGLDVFPVGRSTVKRLNGSLVYLTRADREGKNWKAVPGVGKKSNLLIVYLESVPELEVPIADMFTGGDESEAQYEAVCMHVCEALRGRPSYETDLLRLFVLNKIDPGRVQVELSDTFTAAEAIRGAEEWIAGARDRPLLPLKVEGFVPSPEEAMRCLQKKWEQGGHGYAWAPGCRLKDIFDILVAARIGARDAAEHLLRLTLDRTAELLIAIGAAVHRGRAAAWKGIAKDGAKEAVIAAGLLGILLRKSRGGKEKGMEDAAFLMGRFLSLADTLHAQYCEHVRKGAQPPQLLGNALIPTAVGDPRKGLARMLHRFRPYQAWARSPKGSGLAKWTCGEMGKIAGEIASQLPDRRLNDAEQAQLLLGYVARTEKSEEGAQN